MLIKTTKTFHTMKYFESYSISYNCLLLYLFGWVVVVFAIPGPDFSFYWFSANFTFVSAYSVVGGGGGGPRTRGRAHCYWPLCWFSVCQKHCVVVAPLLSSAPPLGILLGKNKIFIRKIENLMGNFLTLTVNVTKRVNGRH